MRKLSKAERREDRVVWTVGKKGKGAPLFNYAKLMAIGWFGGIFMLYWVYQFTDISFTETFKWLVLFAVVFTLVPYKWVLSIVDIEYTQLVALNVVGLGPFFTGVFLMLNLLFAGSPEIVTYKIYRSGRSQIPFENHYVVVELENNALKDQPRFRRFDESYLMDIIDSDSVTFTISEGLFGYKVLRNYELKSSLYK